MLFQQFQAVRHLRGNRTYLIIGTPARFRIEATQAPAYAYTASDTGEIWVRPQAEMEDGRFVPVHAPKLTHSITSDRDRLLTLATKHCPKDHHDWQTLLDLTGEE